LFGSKNIDAEIATTANLSGRGPVKESGASQFFAQTQIADVFRLELGGFGIDAMLGHQL
jgi:hypothetical protein